MNCPGIWIRSTVSRFFNISRVPARDCDYLTTIDKSNTASKKVLVMVHDCFYTIDAYDEYGRLSGYEEIVLRLNQIVADVHRRLEKGEKATPVGILTGNDRDSWASVRVYSVLIDFEH